MRTIYIFNCPCHGEEQSVLCFRAFDKANIDLWRKYQILRERQDLPKDEINTLLCKLKNQDMGNRI